MKIPNGNSVNYLFRKYFIFCFLLISLFCDVANSKVVTISVHDFKFTPDYIHITAGDVIRWTWVGPSPYSIVCDGQFPGTSIPLGASGWELQLSHDYTELETRISVAGIYNYVCSNSSPLTYGTIVAEAPLPVELMDFVATTIKNEVILDWATVGEIDNDRFEIQRIDITNVVDLDPVDFKFATVGVLYGSGTSNSNHEYKFHDSNMKSGTYMYRLKQVDYNGNFFFHLLENEIVVGVPNKFIVMQNFPNPFNPTTKINYETPEDGNVKITLLDVTGKVSGIIFNQFVHAGYQTLNFNGGPYSSGIYFYKIDFNSTNNSLTKTKKMLLIK